MPRFSSIASSFTHQSALFIVLLIILNHCSTSANKFDYRNPSNLYENAVYDDIDDNSGSFIVNPKNLFIADSHERSVRNPWVQLFHYYQDQPHYPSYRRYDSQPASFARRSIPIELQKALFAHGIVGRRR